MVSPGTRRGQNHCGARRSRGALPLLAIEAYTRRLLRHVQPIIVANRAPLGLQRADPIRGTPERLGRGAGGLVTPMSSLAAATDAVWVAAARNQDDRVPPARADNDIPPL